MQTNESPGSNVGKEAITKVRWVGEELNGKEIDEGTTASIWLH